MRKKVISIFFLVTPLFGLAPSAFAAPSIDMQLTVREANLSLPPEEDQNCSESDSVGSDESETTISVCYRLVNNGDVVLTNFTISDSVDGTLYESFTFTLNPAGTLFIDLRKTVPNDIQISATVVASNPSLGVSVSDTDEVDIIFDAEQLTCDGGAVEFEGPLHPTWNNVNIPESTVYWLTSQFPTACNAANPKNAAGGRGYAACADADLHNSIPESYSAKLRTTVDVSGKDFALLKFRWRHRKNGNSLFRTSIRSPGGSFQTVLLNTTGNPSGSEGDEFEVNLSPLLETGQETLEVLFTYQGNSWDWYAHVDSVELVCTKPIEELCVPIKSENGKIAVICL